MTQSPNLSLSLIAPQQAQKHVTVNESLLRLDALVQLAVVSRAIAAEPAAPSDGEAYILPAGKTGAQWSAMADQSIAVFQSGSWIEIAPREGFLAFVADESLFYRVAGGNWGALSAGAAESAPKFGVNTAADDVNRLAVKSDATLFSHDDVTPGAGDHKAKINKSAAARTASLVLQAAFSSRAEIGLIGDDKLRIKVSADGATWIDAAVIDEATGKIGMGVSAPTQGLHLRDRSIVVDSAAGAAGAITVGGWGGTTSEYFGLMNKAGGYLIISGVADKSTYISSQAGGSIVFRPNNNGTPGQVNIMATGATFGAPTGGAKGAGTINATAVYDDNALLSCYVFDQALARLIHPKIA